MTEQCDIENNLNDFIHDYKSKDIKFYIYKIKNFDYFFLFAQTEIQILSFTIKNDKCVIKLHQKLKFVKKLYFFYSENSKSRFFLQEDDGSKIYLLYKDRLITLSNNNFYFQIQTIVRYNIINKNENNGGYIMRCFDKYKNKIYIFLYNPSLFCYGGVFIEINLNNYRIKKFTINEKYITSFIVFKDYILYIKNSEYDDYSYIYIFDLNKRKETNVKTLLGKWSVEKYKIKNILLFKRSNSSYSDYYILQNAVEFWKFENNKFKYLNEFILIDDIDKL
jgi:hypothetical protein